MGRYVRKTTRQSDEVSMQRAIRAVRSGEIGLKKACIQFNIPRSTLQRRCRNDGPSSAAAQKGLGSKRPCFPLELEKEMVAHVKQMEDMLFGFTPNQLRESAFQFAEINNIPKMSTQKRRLPATIGFGDSYHATENCHYGHRKRRQLLERRVSTE